MTAVPTPIPVERPIAVPPAADWPAISWRPRSAVLGGLRTSARRSLQVAAARFFQTLAQTAAAVGIQLPDADLAPTGGCSEPLLITGHQPVIFHAGLVTKYQLTEAVAAARNCRAMAVIIDTDEGDPGAFEVPDSAMAYGIPAAPSTPSGQNPGVSSQNSLQPLRSRVVTFSAGSGLYAACRLAGSAERSETAAAVKKSLLAVGCTEAALAFAGAAGEYCRLPDNLPMATANTLVRRAAGIGSRMAEVPLTTLCGLPEVLRFFSEILSGAAEFHTIYNLVLTSWRQQQGIRNNANPFPNLRSTSGTLELPFWLVDPARGHRAVAWLHLNSAGHPVIGTEQQPLTELPPGFEPETLLSLRLAGQLLVPRGALITATLRLLFSDLFIHGLGGGRYDPVADELIRQWWQEDPPPFAVASASLCLFPKQRARLRQFAEFRAQHRDLQFNPGRYLDAGIFSAEQSVELRRLLADKQSAVDELQSHRDAGTSGREAGRRIQQVSDLIRSRVTEILQTQLAAAEEISEETVRAIESRTWPWFYFSGDWDAAARAILRQTEA